jgi:trehalose 6-phosphate synthase/phosphatase
MPTDRRLIIASNRLPFVIQRDRGEPTLQQTCGGLASALGAVHRRGTNVWVGWPGECDALAVDERARLEGWFRQKRVVPIDLTAGDLAGYYDGVCNSVLWPVFHSLLDRLPIAFPEFETYRAINERFADTIVREYRDGDILWIHDYHLLLAPAMVRTRLPHAEIGFFLHTPFPAADVFRALPWRRELLDGVLGSTLVGFQTEHDVRNFQETARLIGGYHTDHCAIIAGGREVRCGSHPIGIDPLRLLASDHRQNADHEDRELALSGRRLFLGVDRLDYSKGISRRLAAFQQLLESRPDLRGQVELLQVAVPSRTHVPSYAQCKQEIEGLVASINARYATADWTPVRYVPRAVSSRDLSRLYKAADVMLVTSLRDGMNLVAKEFVLSRTDEDGVLILSELAGAAEELSESILINPYSVDQLFEAMADALTIERDDRRHRMRLLRQRVARGTVDTWMDRFLCDLLRPAGSGCAARAHVVEDVRRSVLAGEEIALVLQYEHVLVPPSHCAEPFRPDPELLDLFRRLTGFPGMAVHVVSGFDHETLDRWFESAPVTIWAEHGLWRRDRDGYRWKRTEWVSLDWTDDVRELLEQFARQTPGALVDECGTEFLWDFSRAERVHGRSQAQLLTALLRDGAVTMGFVVSEQPHAIHVAPAGVSFDRTVQRIRQLSGSRHRPVIFDDAERDRHDGHAVREMLRRLVDAPPAPALVPVAQDWTMMPFRTA